MKEEEKEGPRGLEVVQVLTDKLKTLHRTNVNHSVVVEVLESLDLLFLVHLEQSRRRTPPARSPGSCPRSPAMPCCSFQWWDGQGGSHGQHSGRGMVILGPG